MVTVVVSMTMHHGAMASEMDHAGHHPVGQAHHVSDQPCAGDCAGDSHGMPTCCGMGLCLSGLPVPPQAGLAVKLGASTSPFGRVLEPRAVVFRIDRPPKFLDRAA
jgi:hypothetical protein